jgi:hypothetical protein
VVLFLPCLSVLREALQVVGSALLEWRSDFGPAVTAHSSSGDSTTTSPPHHQDCIADQNMIFYLLQASAWYHGNLACGIFVHCNLTEKCNESLAHTLAKRKLRFWSIRSSKNVAWTQHLDKIGTLREASGGLIVCLNKSATSGVIDFDFARLETVIAKRQNLHVAPLPVVRPGSLVMILPQADLRRPCDDFYFL